MSDIKSALREYFEQGGYQKYLNDTIRGILSKRPKIKVVINTCFGGFSLSTFALDSLGLSQIEVYDMARDDAQLIALIEKEGAARVSGVVASLKIAEAPAGSDWFIINYDGVEDLSW